MNWIPIIKLGAWCVVIPAIISYLTIAVVLILSIILKQKPKYVIRYDVKSQLGYLLFGLCLGILLYL